MDKENNSAGLYYGLPCLRLGRRFIVFSPYTGKIASLTYKELKDRRIKEKLKKEGFFGKPKVLTRYRKGEERLTLLVTSDCNLRCIYCFAYGGEASFYMNKELAIRSVKEVLKPDSRKLHLYFFGGEPTLNFNCIKAAVEYVLRNTNVEPLFEITTNCVMGEDKLNYLIKNNFLFFVSIDGPPDIQNYQRPTLAGNPSHSIVERNIKKIISEGCDLKVRTTITSYSVNRMSEIIEYFYQLGIKCVHFEPFTPSGRGKGKEFLKPTAESYITNFKKALDTAKRYDMKVTDSSLFFLLNPTSQFCFSSHGGRLMVTPEGKVTLCLEVQREYTPLSDLFIVGEYNKEKDKFVIDPSKMKTLIKHSVEFMKECKNCFAKYICCGGCPAHNFIETGDPYKPSKYFCKIRRGIIKDAIIRIWKSTIENEKK
jgi:uncharacterized protein